MTQQLSEKWSRNSQLSENKILKMKYNVGIVSRDTQQIKKNIQYIFLDKVQHIGSLSKFTNL